MSQRYYSDYQVGDVFITPSRTICEADVMQFAGLTGDYNELHTSDMFAKKTPFGERIGHGLLTLSVANGLFMRTVQSSTVFLGIKDWNFVSAVRLGDSIYLRASVEAMRLTKNPAKGIMTWNYEVYNQKDELVAKGTLLRMIDNPQA